MEKEQYIDEAIAHAKEDLENEICGLVVIFKGKRKYIRCNNSAANPKDDFVIPAEDWVKADAAGEIVGIVHSHPRSRPTPSQADKVSCERSGLPWTIVNPRTEEFHTFEPSGYQPPLYGREYCFGVLDCYSFIQDFYKQEYGLILRDYEREDKFWEKGLNLYTDFMALEGFYPIEEKNLKPGDGIIMNIASDIGNHGAVYLGDGMMAHHLYHRLSSRDVYGGYYRKHMLLCVRHKDLNQ